MRGFRYVQCVTLLNTKTKYDKKAQSNFLKIIKVSVGFVFGTCTAKIKFGK